MLEAGGLRTIDFGVFDKILSTFRGVCVNSSKILLKKIESNSRKCCQNDPNPQNLAFLTPSISGYSTVLWVGEEVNSSYLMLQPPCPSSSHYMHHRSLCINKQFKENKLFLFLDTQYRFHPSWFLLA